MRGGVKQQVFEYAELVSAQQAPRYQFGVNPFLCQQFHGLFVVLRDGI